MTEYASQKYEVELVLFKNSCVDKIKNICIIKVKKKASPNFSLNLHSNSECIIQFIFTAKFRLKDKK